MVVVVVSSSGGGGGGGEKTGMEKKSAAQKVVQERGKRLLLRTAPTTSKPVSNPRKWATRETRVWVGFKGPDKARDPETKTWWVDVPDSRPQNLGLYLEIYLSVERLAELDRCWVTALSHCGKRIPSPRPLVSHSVNGSIYSKFSAFPVLPPFLPFTSPPLCY